MPILEDRTPLIIPDENLIVSKYIDIIKFLSLLTKNALFFCRLDKLEDKFEGTTAKKNFSERVNWYSTVHHHTQTPLTEDEVFTKVKQQYEIEQIVKETNCISCWNKSTRESAALWKIYSDFGKGIMLKSSIKKIKEAFINSNEDIRISEVKYINYENEIMPDGNLFFPIIHKQDAYSYENEVRLIHAVDFPQIGKIYDWSKEESDVGKYIKVDVNTLIDEIVVGPFSPKWMIELLGNIADKYNLTAPITKSTLAI